MKNDRQRARHQARRQRNRPGKRIWVGIDYSSASDTTHAVWLQKNGAGTYLMVDEIRRGR